MRRIVLVLSVALAALAVPCFVFAAPFDNKVVASNPALILHFDWDLIRNSAVGQALLSRPDMKNRMASNGALFDFDFQTQLHGITVYTTEANPKDTVMIVDARFDADHLLAKAQTLPDFRGETNGSHVVYSWLDEKWKRRLGGAARTYGAISGHHIIFGQAEARLWDALDVLEGKARIFDRPGELPQANRSEAMLLEAALLKVDFPNAQGPAVMFKMAKSVRLKVSEANNTTTADLRLQTADAETSGQVKSMAETLLGMLKLNSENADAMKFANSISIAQDGLTVGVTLSMRSSEMVDLMNDGMEKADQKRASRRAGAKDAPPNNR